MYYIYIIMMHHNENTRYWSTFVLLVELLLHSNIYCTSHMKHAHDNLNALCLTHKDGLRLQHCIRVRMSVWCAIMRNFVLL